MGYEKMELKVFSEKGVDIPKDFVGVFFEDINYGADGGIYAEMLENRSFEFVDARGDKDKYFQIFDGLYGWNAYPDRGQAALKIEVRDALNTVNPHYLAVNAKAGAGFTNKAYDGIFVENGKHYHLSFWAKTKKAQQLEIAAFTENEKKVTLATVQVADENWKKYEVVCTPEETVRNGLFAILFEEAGEVSFDCISMFPEDAVCGVFRKDLVDKLQELQPGFIRFPGGCIVEGNELANRYQWKHTVGPIEERKANWNRWAVHGNCKENEFVSKYSHYNQTYGLGYYEYFLLCEYLGAKPLPVMNVGLACQYQSTQLVERTDLAYEEFIQDALDLIEFANGAPDTKWGALRASMGHKEPFALEMIGIGNEQWQTEQVDFFERYDDFEKAIHGKYPEMKLIGSAGPTVHTPTYEAAWKNYYEKCEKNLDYTYAVDEHYYMEPEWFLNHTHFYDDYDRRVKVFSGEYAAHDREENRENKKNNWKCALAEAAFLTGVERNADVVWLTSYAPLFARIGYVQWSPDLIWFDDKTSYATPSFYVQKMFSRCTGAYTLKSEAPEAEKNQLYHVVSYHPEEKCMYIKLVNASEKEQEITLELAEEWEKLDNQKVFTLSGSLQDVNSIEEPEKVTPQESVGKRETSLKIEPHTVKVIMLS